VEQDDPWAIIPATPYRSAPARMRRRRRSPLAVASLAVLWTVMMAALFAGGIQLYRLGHGLLVTPHPAAVHRQMPPATITTPPTPALTPAATRAHRRHRHHHHSQLAAEVPVPIPPPPAPVPVITSTPPHRSPTPTPPTPSPTPTTPEPTTPEPTPTPTSGSPSPEPSLTGSPSSGGQ